MLTDESCNRLNAIYRFVRSHGFEASVTDVVTVQIPFIDLDDARNNGYEIFKIRTMEQARKVLGY